MEVKDPEIKLFGKKIAFPATTAGAGEDYSSDSGGPGAVYNGENSCGSDSEPSKVSHRAPEESEAEDERETQKQVLANKDFSSGPDEKSTMDEDSPTKQSQKSESDQGDSTNQQPKLKKPDKILPCPRCSSMDTKFCYYNNYNVNQPRHFCKSCQRYWTAGGTMRNVPVGAGRRKNKNSASHCRHITISEALQAARFDPSNGFQHLNFKHNGTVLSFGSGSGSPLCDSMASVLHLSDKKMPSGSENGFHKLDPKSLVSCRRTENGDDSSGGSSVTTSNSAAEGAKNGLQLQEPVVQQMNGFPSPIPCLPGVPWPYSSNPAVPLPAVYPSGFPMPFYPAPYWNCGVPGAWNVPWVPPVVPISCTNLPILGKHPRDTDELVKTDNSEEKKSLQEQNWENSVLVPKILRIGDPDEAAKSSIWTTLGINYDSVSREGLFKALQPKADKKEQHVDANTPVLQANPAALSRSVTFQEGA